VEDMREKLGRMCSPNTRGEAVTAEDLGVAGALTGVMKDAIMPNLMQTLEGRRPLCTPGRSPNIAHGNSSIVADQMRETRRQGRLRGNGIRLRADIGPWRNSSTSKCRLLGLDPRCHLIVATIRALKMHGGGRRSWQANRSITPTPARIWNCWKRACQHGASHSQCQALRCAGGQSPSTRSKDDTEAEIRVVPVCHAGGRRRCLQVHAHGCTAARAPSSWPGRDEGRPQAKPVRVPLSAGHHHQREIEAIPRFYGARVWMLARKPSEGGTVHRLGFDKLPSAWRRRTCPSPTGRTSKARRPAFRLPIREHPRGGVARASCIRSSASMRTMPRPAYPPRVLMMSIQSGDGQGG